MTKRKPELHVTTNLNDIFEPLPQLMTVEKALGIVLRQMQAAGLRERTIDDYDRHVTHFAKVTGVKLLRELNANHIYDWLSSMNVSNQTKLTRLKCIKAFLSRCFDAGWLESKFWTNIRIKVDTPVKEGVADREITVLLSMLDLNKFVELRDATAVLVMYQTGLRVGTVAKLRHKHVKLIEQLLQVDGSLIKNHDSLYLPFDDVLKRFLTVLMEQNDKMRAARNLQGDYLFMTINGGSIFSTPTNNILTKRLKMYSKMYGLKNLNPHAIRRGFAKNLLRKGANIALISKALGHSNIEVTTRYLHLDKEEVAESLRKFL
ncbi:tyrosine-type recombinase/integrase [Jeotgalibacillus aurantiacus]|uniref:tyrosine-type recombinase/integrase n=1 Tax=Jeotgalibacillus aurantiacus TaxID=2763266 RepID=UPI001D0B32FB|nr:site-specific integrase [Jeotgalibacillus aurantiacus]